MHSLQSLFETPGCARPWQQHRRLSRPRQPHCYSYFSCHCYDYCYYCWYYFLLLLLLLVPLVLVAVTCSAACIPHVRILGQISASGGSAEQGPGASARENALKLGSCSHH